MDAIAVYEPEMLKEVMPSILKKSRVYDVAAPLIGRNSRFPMNKKKERDFSDPMEICGKNNAS
jgi:hypothetical protein